MVVALRLGSTTRSDIGDDDEFMANMYTDDGGIY